MKKADVKTMEKTDGSERYQYIVRRYSNRYRYFKTFVTDNNMLYDDLLAALKLQEI
ncbi:MAG: hypothetical protein WA323_23175 [Candidatus Nitrosopolaris sp.]